MENIKLNNGVEMPVLGLGVFQSPVGKMTEDAVIWALQDGYVHIDTAMIYENEASVGSAIIKSGVPREDIFLTTKLWNEDIRQGRTGQAFKESLEKLKTDYADLYLIHWPAVGYEKAWEEMAGLYSEGSVKAIGVSNFQIHHLEHLLANTECVPAVNQIESNPYFRNQEVIDYCLEHGIAVTVWSPLGGTGSQIFQDETLKELAIKYQKSVSQVVIRWHLQRGVIAIPKSLHEDWIKDNLNVFDFELCGSDMGLINGLDKGQRCGPDPDNFNF